MRAADLFGEASTELCTGSDASKSSVVSWCCRITSRCSSDRRTDESEKLRNEIRAKEESLRTMEDEMQDLRSEQGKAQHELHFAEMRIKELEDEVAAAHAAEHDLRSQKAANLSLKEELNRLRLEIDAANTRQQAASSNGSSQHASVSRSLGRELERRLAAMNDDEPGSGSDTEGENDAMAALKRSTSSASSSGSFIEETVTRIRRRVRALLLLLVLGRKCWSIEEQGWRASRAGLEGRPHRRRH